jgi:quinolinate synthase
MKNEYPEVLVSEKIRLKAEVPIKRMLEISSDKKSCHLVLNH